MSFADRNGKWLLPALGIALAGVVRMNLRRPASEPAQRFEPARATDPAPTALTAPQGQNVAMLLQAGRHPLTDPLRRPPGPPSLHPDQWSALPAPSWPGPSAALPSLDFIITRGAVREAWIEGRPHRAGSILRGGFILLQITESGIVIRGSRGRKTCSLGTTPAGAPTVETEERP